MLLIGSQALKYWGKLDREPKDWDFIATIDEVESFIGRHKEKIVSSYPIKDGDKIIVHMKDELPIEFEVAWEGTTGESLLKRYDSYMQIHDKVNLKNVFGLYVQVAEPNTLFELKHSHRFLKNSPHFLKTMKDWRFLRDECGCEIENPEWVKQREKETYTYSHPKLNVSKDNFFKGDEVPYIYDHDTVHIAVKRGEKPAYEYYLEDGEEVKCSKEKFFSAPEEVRLNGVLEEAMVLALERSQIPHKGVLTPKESFEIALFKVCTSITSGWFREFGWLNYPKVMELYDDKYVDKFWKAVDEGIVKKLPEGKTGPYV